MSFDASAVQPFARMVFDAALHGAFDEIDKVIQVEFARKFAPLDDPHFDYFKILKDWSNCFKEKSKGPTQVLQKLSSAQDCHKGLCEKKDVSSAGMNWACTHLWKQISDFSDIVIPSDKWHSSELFK